jgi:hypothetical protein
MRVLSTFVVAFALAVPTLPAFGADAYPPALYAALTGEESVKMCARFARETREEYVRQMMVKRTTLANGTVISFALGQDECINPAHNAACFAYVKSADGTFRLVYSGDAAPFNADGSLVVYGHMSAFVQTRATYAFDGTTYRHIRDDVVWENREVKPASVPVHFAYGASSATVSGKVHYEFPDTYLLAASAGQTMSVVVRPTRGTVGNLSVTTGPTRYQGKALTDSDKLSWSGKLPTSGSYSVSIDGAPNNDVRASATYTMTISIR